MPPGTELTAPMTQRLAERKHSQASPEQARNDDEAPEGPEDEEWRRRESNPRDIPAAPNLARQVRLVGIEEIESVTVGVVSIWLPSALLEDHEHVMS